MTPDDDDEEEFERFMSLSDEEQDRELQTTLREYEEWWRTLTHKQQLRVQIRSTLRTCRGWRRLIRDVPGLADMWRDRLRNRQIRLAALRHERRTGITPGRA